MSYCTKCGSKLSNNSAFCSECGQKINIRTIPTTISKPTIETNSLDSKKTSNLKIYLLAIGLAILTLANPTQTDFEIFLNNQINQKYPNSQQDEDFLGNLLKGVVKSYATDYIKQSTIRQNYFILSTYTVNLTGLQNFVTTLPSSIKFVGILGTFIPLSDTNSIN